MRFAFIFAALHSFLALAVVFLDDVTVETARIVMVQTQLAVSLIFSLHGLASWTAFDIAIPGQSYLESSTHWVKNVGKSLNSFSSQHCPWRSNSHVGASFYPRALGWLSPSLPYLDDLPPEIILRISNFVATQDDGSSVLAWARSSKHMRQMLWPSSYWTISVTAYPDQGPGRTASAGESRASYQN
ncbi:hypothetical protein DL96DRAFT_853548 [Flagelloscypha sp. PMI_526]|nr:hypothetical protein DL96DRAFT_853548 [Flagelloscypha sp. PMI_526]